MIVDLVISHLIKINNGNYYFLISFFTTSLVISSTSCVVDGIYVAEKMVAKGRLGQGG